jgi:hypothetical protein
MAKGRIPIYAGMTPAKFEYKPLGLENFAQPLAQMQQRYDLTEQAIQDQPFGIDAISANTARAKEIEQDFTGAKASLMAELEKTGDTKGAARKLKELNKIYNEDTEIGLLRKQKLDKQAAIDAMREEVTEGHQTETDYQKWYNYITGNEQALNYNRETGAYNPFSYTKKERNLDKEIVDLSVKLASGAPAQVLEQYGDWKDINPDLMSLLKRREEFTSADLTQEIANLLRSSSRYQDYLYDEAKYEHYNARSTSTNPNEFDINAIAQVKKLYEDDIALANAALLDPKEATNKKYWEQRKAEQEQHLKDLNTNIAESIENGTTEQYAGQLWQSMFVEDQINKYSSGAEDVYDYRKSTLNQTIKGEGGGAGSGKTAIDEVDKYNITTTEKAQTHTYQNQKSGVRPGGGTGANEPYANQYQEHKKELWNVISDSNKVETQDAEIQGVQNWFKHKNKSWYNANKGAIDAVHTYAQFWGGLNQTYIDYENEINTLNAKKEDKIAKWEKATGNEKKELKSEINELSGDIYEAETARNGEFILVDNTIRSYYDKIPELKETYIKNDFKGALQWLADDNYNKLNKVKIQQQKNLDKITKEVEEDIVDGAVIPNVEAEVMHRMGEVYKTMNPIWLKTLTPSGFKMRGDINDILEKEFSMKPLEIVVDEASDLYTKGGLTKYIDFIHNNNIEHNIKRVENFNKITGESEISENTDKYDLEMYVDSKNPQWFGVTSDQGGGVVFEFDRVPYEVTTAHVLKKWEEYAEATAEAGKPAKFGSYAEFEKAYLEANPEKLVLQVSGVSTNLDRDAALTFEERGKATLGYGETAAFNSYLDSFASMNILSDGDRRNDYFEMAATLQKAKEKGTSKPAVVQPPAHWEVNENGVLEGHNIAYSYVEGKGLMASVQKIHLNPITQEVIARTPLDSIPITGNFAKAMRRIDIYYGAGSERDIVKDGDGNAFVPAFFISNMGQKDYSYSTQLSK